MSLYDNYASNYPALVSHLENARKHHRLAHAFLVHADTERARREFAVVLAQIAACPDSREGRPCTVCRVCRQLEQGTYSEFYTLSPVGKMYFIKIGERGKPEPNTLRYFEEQFHLTSTGGANRKVGVIYDADRMNDESQNALLKTLEEPDGRTAFFLLTAHPEGLLATIRSRCRPVFMPRLSEEIIASELIGRGMSEGRARYAARLSQGVMGRAIALCREDDPYFAWRDEAVKLMQTLRRKDDAPRAASAWNEKRKPEDCQAFLDALETVLRDVMRVQSGLAPFDGQIQEALEEMAGHFTIDRIACIMEEAVRVRKRLGAHVQWRSAWTPLLLKIVED